MSRTDQPFGPRIWPPLVTVAALGSLPYLSLLAANVGEGIDLGRVFTWWAVTVATGLAAVVVGLRAGRGTAGRVGALAGVALYLGFNYPAIVELREATNAPLHDVVWWALVAAVVVAIAFPVTRSVRVQLLLAVWAAAMLLPPVAQLATSTPSAAVTGTSPGDAEEVALTHRPNVYWFVLDGQAGPPFLRDEIGLDPDPFLDHLRSRGFEVLEDARSNYPFTHLSMGSALEMEYVYEGVEEPRPGPFLERLQGDNETVDIFLANGYRYVHAYPGLWTGSRCSGREDLCLGDHGPMGDTEWALLSMTPLIDVVVDERAAGSIARANDPLQVVDSVLASAPEPPYFALVHLLNPHPPYLRDASCSVRDMPLDFAAWGEGGAYGEAVTCLFDRLASSVDRILAVDDDPIIIIQGDHGPRLGLSASTSGEVLLDDDMFFSALAAVRLPEPCADLDVPDDLTPVNTFRIVFGCLQDRAPVLLPNRTFPILRDY